eukprot:gnl/TRDRNA2_/TRDRNA2_188834_c0_seq1.p1 gnl/TRDRNA2_/TRDRNA2_188834_c0~~gnl/TRDRNA2_/TRDRNA2_188834_c0_seq1.p1  ORF type:complete len:153 (+),score=41.32 gnl/TRDRNA2_/TRDRNA2_188834_c0_seq1:65-523(+)
MKDVLGIPPTSGIRVLDGAALVVVNGVTEEVVMHPELGPLACNLDGKLRAYKHKYGWSTNMNGYDNTSHGHYDDRLRNMHNGKKGWHSMSNSEKECLLHLTAKKNQQMKNLKGRDFWAAAEEEVKALAIQNMIQEGHFEEDFHEETNGDEVG